MPILPRQQVTDPDQAAPTLDGINGASTAAPDPSPSATGLHVNDSADGAPSTPTTLVVADPSPPVQTLSEQSIPSEAAGSQESGPAQSSTTTTGLATGTIIGIAVGAFVVFVIMCYLVYTLVRRRSMSRRNRSRSTPMAAQAVSNVPYSEKDRERRKSHNELWHKLQEMPSPNRDIFEEERRGAVRYRDGNPGASTAANMAQLTAPHLPYSAHVESWGGDTVVVEDEKTDKHPTDVAIDDSFLSLRSTSAVAAPAPTIPRPQPPNIPPLREESAYIADHPFAAPRISHAPQDSQQSAIDKLIAALDMEADLASRPSAPDSRPPTMDYFHRR